MLQSKFKNLNICVVTNDGLCLFRTAFQPCIHSSFIIVGFVGFNRHFHSPAKPPSEL